MDSKHAQLGMPIGTASARLKKSIMLSLLRELGKDNCYRCGSKIIEANELSIDHKIDWLHNSVTLFWDLDNIAYSHRKCNIPGPSRTGSKRKTTHGRVRRYGQGCRCTECKIAKSKDNAKFRANGRVA